MAELREIFMTLIINSIYTSLYLLKLIIVLTLVACKNPQMKLGLN